MKHSVQMSPTIASENAQKSIMGLAAESSDMFSYFLRDKIYSDKVLACIREYVCNAVDEHVKHNVNVPVDVRLETIDGEQVWSVRDHAKGLNEHDIRNIFGMYGRSTKSKSNEMIGCYGIGSKAAHCYTDTFYIKSYFEGVCTLYACVLGGGEKGVPVGELYKMNESPTTESGLEIYFNVDRFDRDQFVQKTRKFVCSFGKPDAIQFIVNGNTVVTPIVPDETFENSGFKFNLYKDTLRDYYGSYGGTVHIRMGGVIYKSLSVRNDLVDQVVVDVPIGKITIPISREYMEDTNANNAVIETIKKIIIDLEAETKKSAPKLSLAQFMTKISGNGINLGWFKYRIADLYPDNLKAYRNITVAYQPYNGKHPDLLPDGSVPIYVAHNKNSYRNWQKRLHGHLQHQNGYYFILEEDKDEGLLKMPNIDLSNIKFIDVRKVGIPAIKRKPADPKLEQGNVVYQGYSRVGVYTASELEERAEKIAGGKITNNWWKSATTYDKLNIRTIAFDNASAPCLNTKSNTFYKKMIAFGWLAYESQDYRNKYNEIAKRNQEERAKNMFKFEISKYFKTPINERVLERLTKNPKQIERFNKLWRRIQKEGNMRSRLLQALSSYSGTLPRHEFRQIMKLNSQ
jgi:hypothetical protein